MMPDKRAETWSHSILHTHTHTWLPPQHPTGLQILSTLYFFHFKISGLFNLNSYTTLLYIRLCIITFLEKPLYQTPTPNLHPSWLIILPIPLFPKSLATACIQSSCPTIKNKPNARPRIFLSHSSDHLLHLPHKGYNVLVQCLPPI